MEVKDDSGEFVLSWRGKEIPQNILSNIWEEYFNDKPFPS
jgi:hypothetical protein